MAELPQETPYRRRTRSGKGRSRWRVLAVVLPILAVSVLAIVIGVRMGKESVDLRPQSEAILRQISAGDAAKVYGHATTTLQEMILEEKFLELAETMNKSLGKFVKIRDVVDSEVNSGAAGKTARAVFVLEFKNAVTRGEFSYLWVGGKWKLLGLRVSIPDGLEDEVAQLEAAAARVKAPKEVIRLTKSIGEYLRDGKLDEIYAVTSPPFQQSVSRENLGNLIAARTRNLGKFIQLLDIVSSAQNKKKDQAEVSAVLQFERRKTVGRFEFIKTESGQWLLSGFVIPYSSQPI